MGLHAAEYSDKEVSFNLFLVHLVCTTLPNGELRVLEERQINRNVLPDVMRCLMSHVLFHSQYLVSVRELS